MADIHDFRIDLIESTDIGTYGDWETFCLETAEIIRSIVPQPPSLKEYLNCFGINYKVQ